MFSILSDSNPKPASSSWSWLQPNETRSLLPTTGDAATTTCYGSPDITRPNKSNKHSLDEASTCTADTKSSECMSPIREDTTISDNNNNNKRPALTSLQLAAIIFYSVSGGPFGVEESIRAAGPFYTLVGFCVAPLVFSLPECLMTVELASGGFQSSAAGCAWVEEAFGRTAGFLTGYLSWLAGATDNAIYPVLFLEYALQMFPSEALEDGPARVVLITGVSLGLAYMNWLGLDLVGNMSMAVCCIAMSPFVLFVILGASKVDPQRWLRLPVDQDVALALASDDDAVDMEGGFFPNVILGGVLLRPFLNNLFWNFNSFDNAGSFSEDIQSPATVLPRGMMLSLLMVVLGYIIPLLVALGTTDAPPRDWVDGYLATVVSETVGPWLGSWLVFAAALSNIGLFQAELSADAYMLMGMADRGYLPKCLAVRSSNGTPTYSLLLGTLVIVVMGVSNLDSLIEMLNFNYALALLFEYAAFLKLRISKPDVERPFRVPLSTTACAIALIPTLATLVLVIALASYTTICVNAVTITLGVVVYSLMQRNRGYKSVGVANGETPPGV